MTEKEMKEVCEFFDKYGVKYEIKKGKVVCDKGVDLNGITYEDFALPNGFGKVVFNSYVDFENNKNLKSLPEGFKCGGSVYLRGTKIKSLPEGFKCGGCVYLRGTNIESLPEGFVCGGYVYLQDTKIKSLPEGFVCGGNVYLGYTKIKSLPEGFKCGGCVYLQGTNIESLPEGFKCGGYVYLRGTNIKELPKDLKCGGGVYLNNDIIRDSRFREGEETDEYIYCDGILTFIKSKKQIGEYIVYKDVFGKYLVRTKDYNAHGRSIKQCIVDINYKRSDRDSSKYKDIDQNKQLPLDYLIVMYRVITGACSQGVQSFIEANCEKKEYSINELKSLTVGNYGHETFVEFFK